MLGWLAQQPVLAAIAVGGAVLLLMLLIPAIEELVGTYTPFGEFCGRPNLRWAVSILTVVAVFAVVAI